MTRRQIDHRTLLESVLPLHHLPPEVRQLAAEAIRSQLTSLLEVAARRAVEALVDRGILRPLVSPPGARAGSAYYLNRETGDTLLISWAPAEAPALRKVLLPPVGDAPGIRPSHVQMILNLGAQFYHSEGNLPSTYGEIIRAAVTSAADLLQPDFAAFVPTRAPSDELATQPEILVSREHAAAIGAHLAPGERAVLYIPDVTRVEGIRELAPAAGLLSAAIATVRTPGASLALEGFLELWSRRRGFLGDEQLLTLGLLAGQLAESFRKAEVLERLVFYDSLTGLYNRHFFNLQLEKEIARARRAGHSFALAIADLDDFRAINAAYGYYGGNELLVQVGHLLRGSVRPFDIAARWGGEEFALILTPPVGQQEAVAVSTRIRDLVAAHPFEITGLDLHTHRVMLSLSVGVSIFPTHARTGKEMWTAANGALRIAKTRGKNQVVCFAPELRAAG